MRMPRWPWLSRELLEDRSGGAAAVGPGPGVVLADLHVYTTATTYSESEIDCEPETSRSGLRLAMHCL